MKKIAFVFALAVGLGAASAEDLAKKELAKFQGEWTVAWAEKGGKKLTDDERKSLSKFFLTKIVITDDSIVAWIKEQDADESKPGNPFTMQIDPGKTPKTIVFGDVPGIYAFDGEMLKVCTHLEFSKMADDVPKSLDTSKSETAYLFVFKRAAKK